MAIKLGRVQSILSIEMSISYQRLRSLHAADLADALAADEAKLGDALNGGAACERCRQCVPYRADFGVVEHAITRRQFRRLAHALHRIAVEVAARDRPPRMARVSSNTRQA